MWQWHQLDHMQIICTSLQTDNDASISPLSFLQAGCPSCYPTNSLLMDPLDLNFCRPIFSLSFLSKILEHVIDSRGPIHRHCLKIYPKTCLSTITAELFSHSAPDQDTGLLWRQQEVCCSTGVPLHCSAAADLYPVYTIQPVVKPVVMFVYTIQLVVKPVSQPV